MIKLRYEVFLNDEFYTHATLNWFASSRNEGSFSWDIEYHRWVSRNFIAYSHKKNITYFVFNGAGGDTAQFYLDLKETFKTKNNKYLKLYQTIFFENYLENVNAS
jgi:hypothetical protein